MHLFAVLLFQVLSACLAYDIQLEGKMNLGNDFIKMLKGNEKIMELSNKATQTPDLKKMTRYIYQRADDIVPTRTEKLNDYVYHIKKKGDKTLDYFGKFIKRKMNLEKNLTYLIHTTIGDFKTKLKDYLNIVLSDKPEYEIDEEFVFLDMVETSNRMLYGQGKRLLNDIITDINDARETAEIRLINKKIYKESVTSKKEEMEYICSNYKVCRNYPSFTDYSADFLSEILKMPNSKFEMVVKVVSDALQSKIYFFNTIIRDEDMEVIVKEIEKYLRDTSSIREFLSVLRAVMTQRFKIVHNSNTVLKARTKAVRILLDIIDKALLDEKQYLLSIDFSNTVHAIRVWERGERDDINDILGKFIDNIIHTLNYVFTVNTRNEVKVLVEVILRGRTDTGAYEYINKIGSKFVRGEDEIISNDIF